MRLEAPLRVGQRSAGSEQSAFQRGAQRPHRLVTTPARSKDNCRALYRCTHISALRVAVSMCGSGLQQLTGAAADDLTVGVSHLAIHKRVFHAF